MRAEQFRRLAAGLPDAVEGTHMGHADFRIGGRVFATLGYPSSDWAMVKLTPSQQQLLAQAEPGVFEAVKGAWGARGATGVRLSAARTRSVREALVTARNNAARKPLVKRKKG
ncbi:MAG: MmcQ/YjbR family DNA-binding protein [Gemmatimonadales bacterium]